MLESVVRIGTEEEHDIKDKNSFQIEKKKLESIFFVFPFFVSLSLSAFFLSSVNMCVYVYAIVCIYAEENAYNSIVCVAIIINVLLTLN